MTDVTTIPMRHISPKRYVLFCFCFSFCPFASGLKYKNLKASVAGITNNKVQSHL